MGFLKGIFRKHKSVEDVKRKSSLCGISRDVDPMTFWDIISELGDGAFGKVYKTKRKDSDLTSALKKVDFDSETELEDFMVEIEILTQFKHPNILSLLEVFIYESKLWMFLELCNGGALDSIMNTLDKPLSESQIQFVAREVLSGLQFLHENLVIHRDMKAGNILLTSAYEIRLADFGVSARLTNEKQMRHTFIGTPYWMAPEVIACDSPKDSPYNWKADIWSFGITLIELAQMRPPHNEVNPSRVLIRITRSEPPTLARPKKWSSDFSSMLAQCLQKDPSSRPDCAELLKHPFIANVTDDYRKQIEMLICEAKADVIDVVEEVDLGDVPEGMVDEPDKNVLILPDQTKIEIPVELPEEEEDGLELDITDATTSSGDQPVIASPSKPNKPEGMVDEPDKNVLILPDQTKIEIPAELPEDVDDSLELDITAATTSSGDQPVIASPSKPNKELLHELSEELADQLIDDVVRSEKRHPSVPSCVFEVMRELSEQVETVSEPCATSTTDSVEPSPKQGAPLSRRHSAYRTMTRTRRFVVDGQEMTSTTRRIVRAIPEEQKIRDDMLNQRKVELRAFRVLGKREAHQKRELAQRAKQQRDMVKAKITAEFIALKKNYDQKMEMASRNYRMQIERLEKEHEIELKRLRTSSTKEEQIFKERIRSELGGYSRAERKAARRELQSEHPLSSRSSSSSNLSSSNASGASGGGSVISAKLSEFREQHENRFKESLHKCIVLHCARLEDAQRAELVEKQSLRLTYEQEKWNMDQRHLQLRHQLARNQLIDSFAIKRQKLVGLLELELNGLRETILQERATLITFHAVERKNHTKLMKTMFKRNTAMFQRQFRNSYVGPSSQYREKLRENTEEERQKMEEESRRFDEQQRARSESLEQSFVDRMKELEINHASRRNELVDLETECLQELDDRYESDLRNYAESLPRTLALLRSQFAKDLDNISHPPPSLEDLNCSTYFGVASRVHSARSAFVKSIHQKSNNF